MMQTYTFQQLELIKSSALPLAKKKRRLETHRVIICTKKQDVQVMLWRVDWLSGTVLWIPAEGYKRRKPKQYRNIYSANRAIKDMIGELEDYGPRGFENYVDAPGHEAHGGFRTSEFYLGVYNP